MAEHRASIDIEATHADLPDGDVPGHAAGWNHFLPRLRRAVASEQLTLDTWTPRERQQP